MGDRYFLKADFQPDWTEVSKEVWIKAERAAGFRPHPNLRDHPDWPNIPATAGFSGNGVSGKIEYALLREPKK